MLESRNTQSTKMDPKFVFVYMGDSNQNKEVASLGMENDVGGNGGRIPGKGWKEASWGEVL